MQRRAFNILLLSSLSSLITILGCKSLPEVCIASEQRLRSTIHRSYREDEERAENDNEYLLQHILSNANLCERFSSIDSCRKELEERLKRNKDNPIGRNYSPECLVGWVESFEVEYNKLGPPNIQRLTSRQIIRLHLYLDLFDNKKIKNEIGRKLELDFQDDCAEHGGIIFPGSIETYPSTLEKTRLNNKAYVMPDDKLDIPNIGSFHFHSVLEDSTVFAGPSAFASGPKGLLSGDLSWALARINNEGEKHCLVITKLAKERFHPTYFGGEKIDGKPLLVNIVPLGTYSYKN